MQTAMQIGISLATVQRPRMPPSLGIHLQQVQLAVWRLQITTQIGM